MSGLDWMQDVEQRQGPVPTEHDQSGIAQGPDLSAAATLNHAESPAFGESSAHEATAQAPAKKGKTAFLDSSTGRRSLMAVSLAGIALLGYLQYGPSIRQVPDLLGTNLPSVGAIEPSGPDELRAPIDPRLGGLDQLGISELDTSIQPAQPSLAQPQGLQAEPEASALVAAPAQSPAASATAAAAAAAADPELAARMQRMEAMMIELSQQLAHMREQDAKARAATPTVVQAVPAPAPAPAPATAAAVAPAQSSAPVPTATEPHTARPATSAPRVLVKAQPARAATSRPAVQQKSTSSKAAPAEKPAAPALSGQLIAVDMWAGEPSVVVASGIPGDRRMRVLRPGDVVNGMALKSADPVSRTATFVAPGSPGLTLSVSQGG
ncbi:hypothetical protein NHB13_17340 [Delftia tsuruhatensis]|uniref:hypothetical protein n=1 Tax=Delftia tsuruhatensis TaxID=180282 RepID=UPI002090ABF3|nr:hypothetical protein [Delftia tsuruhatensis]MCO5338369.1 hypothetical protein [Delftia tsuruhatensis]